MLNRNNYMPDVLDCLANLSSDEVFTPPETANKLLDMLPQEVFKSKETTFLDPFTKSGVFLREVTKRLLKVQIPNYDMMSNEIVKIEKTAIQDAIKTGLLDLSEPKYGEKAKKIGREAIGNHPRVDEFYNFESNLQQELNRILTKQVFGIAITELTAQLTRRSLYCSKDAGGDYSVCTAFGANSAGNIRFVPTKHTWKKETCIFCGASKNTLDRPDDFEAHAYEFIHTKKVEGLYNMEFTVICGNPPYQLSDGSGGSTDAAIPIYNKFIQQAKRLNSKYLTMIIPSKWMVGGRGLDKFRQEMIEDKSIKEIHDFEDSKQCFPGVHLDGGVCYFLRERDYNGLIHYVYKTKNGDVIENDRTLKSDYSKFIIRDSRIMSILDKIKDLRRFNDIVSSTKPFGIRKDLFNNPEKYPRSKLSDTPFKGSVHIYGVKGLKGGAKRTEAFISKDMVSNNEGLVNKFKIFFTTSYSTGAIEPPKPIIGEKNDICTETFLVIGPFDTQEEMENCLMYINTNFFKFLLYFGKGSMQVTKSVFALIPLVDFTKNHTDKILYEMFKLSPSEIKFIESMIK